MSTTKPEASDPWFDEAQTEQALLHFLLEHIPDRIYFKDRQSRFLRISRAMAELFSLANPAEAIGRTDFDFFTREHAQPAFDDEQKILQTGAPLIGKIEKETLPDGRIMWVITTKMPLRDQSGAIVGTCGISKDFTDQKNLEDSLARKQAELQHTLDELRETHEQLKAAQRQVIEAEKIQSLGRLALGVAHEIRNPLNILNMAVEFLSTQVSVTGNSTMSAVVSSMTDAVVRADAVITELMDASGDAELTLEPCQIGSVIRSAVERHEKLLASSGITTQVRIPDHLPAVSIDHKKIEETLFGIIQNSIDAMPTGGRLEVSAFEEIIPEVEPDEGSRSAKKLRAGDRILRIEIEDSGSGIPKERINDIFDPFFTTKATGKGTGLGLTVCRKIVELHGGRIIITSSEGAGTRVVIDLPIQP